MILSSGPNLSRTVHPSQMQKPKQQQCTRGSSLNSTGLLSFELVLEKDKHTSVHAEDASSEEDDSVGPGLELTDGSVFSHKAAVCDDRVRVEVQQHWAEGEDGAWDGAPAQGSNRSVNRSQVVDLHPIIDTAGMC